MRLPDGRGDSSDTQFRRAEQNSLQAFYKRLSGPIGTFPSDRGGADAWQITTYGHGVLQTNPHGRALDQESPGSIPGGATRSAMRHRVVSRFDRFGPALRDGPAGAVRR